MERAALVKGVKDGRQTLTRTVGFFVFAFSPMNLSHAPGPILKGCTIISFFG